MTSSFNINTGGCGICLLAVILGCFITVAKGDSDIPDRLRNVGIVWGDEDTNKIRAGVTPYGGAESLIIRSDVLFGDINAGLNFVAPPAIKFSDVELRETNGTIIKPLPGKKVDGNLPQRMAIKDLPRYPAIGTKYRGSSGGIRNCLFGQPAKLSEFTIQNVYHIDNEGDYNLTVCSVIYRFPSDYDSTVISTLSKQFVTRVDLPCVTVKIHLKPVAQAK